MMVLRRVLRVGVPAAPRGALADRGGEQVMEHLVWLWDARLRDARSAPMTLGRPMPMSVDSWRPCVSDAAGSRCHHAATKIKRPDRLLAIRPLTCTFW